MSDLGGLVGAQGYLRAEDGNAEWRPPTALLWSPEEIRRGRALHGLCVRCAFPVTTTSSGAKICRACNPPQSDEQSADTAGGAPGFVSQLPGEWPQMHVNAPQAGDATPDSAQTAPELRPPAEHAEKPLHWLGCAVGAPLVARWRNYGGSAYPACWEVFGWSGNHCFSPAQLAAEGHHYLGPAEWRPTEPYSAPHDTWRGACGHLWSHEARGKSCPHCVDKARIAELETECHRLIAAERRTYETFASRPRLSATWEHLPDVTTTPERDHSALFRAIRSRGP